MPDSTTQKAGRGGAGNIYYPTIDIESVSSQQHDLEAQKLPSFRAFVESRPQGYIRSGRGGAGNFTDPYEESSSPSVGIKSDSHSVEVDPSLARGNGDETTIKTTKTTYRGLGGRGGAGNWVWANDMDEKQRKKVEEHKIQNQVNELVRLDVEQSLKPPPKAYAARESIYRDVK